MQTLCMSDELEIFPTETVTQMLDYKWNSYGFNHHVFGFFVHLVYVVYLMFYVYFYYLIGVSETTGIWMTIALILGFVYFLGYSVVQFSIQGCEVYFNDTWNYIDVGL